MADQTVTQLVIDSDTSGADDYVAAMGRASDAASSGMSTMQGIALSIAGVGAGAVAAVAGLRAFVDMVGNQTQAFVDLENHAQIAGETIKEFQETLFAARSAGVSQSDFFSGMDKIAGDLQQASESATQFGELFKANGLAIKNANGELITTKQALTDIMDLVQNATPAVASQVLRIVGLSQSWLPFLKEGGDEFTALQAKADELGAVIDGSTIQKAIDFNTQWKQAVAVWDAQFRASLANILPMMIQLANIATEILNKIGGISSFFTGALTPDDQKSKTQLDDQINNTERLIEMMQSLNGDMSGSGLAAFRARNLAGMLGLPEDASIDQAFALLDKLQKLYDTPARIQINNGAQGDNSTVLPTYPSYDPLTRQTESIDRRIATMQAEAEAAGKGAGALEQLRTEAQLYEAAQRAGETDLEKYADQFYNLSEKAGLAAEALAKARVAAEIKFGSSSALLSQDDVTIATRLKDIYPDVATALDSAEASQMRFNNAARQLSASVENDLVSGLTDITDGTKTVGQGFSDLAQTVARSIEQMAIKIAIIEPLMRSLQGAISGVGGGFNFGNLLGGAGLTYGQAGTAGSNLFGPVAPSALGNVFSAGQVVPFQFGGVVDSPTLAPMALFGEAGPEAIMPLKRGADGALGVASNAAPAPHINVTLVESPNASGSVAQRANNNGGFDIEIAVAQIAAKSAAMPGAPLNRALSDSFGTRQRVIQR